MLLSFKDLQIQSRAWLVENITELEEKLKYAKQTVKRNALKKSICYWKAQVKEVDGLITGNEVTNKFFERYPTWMPKG